LLLVEAAEYSAAEVKLAERPAARLADLGG
jgi:hypothetical protein